MKADVVPQNDKFAVAVAGISKSYGTTRALHELSLSIPVGEFVALLGQNGAGKSTLFQLLTGLFVPDDGEIVVNGHNIRRNAVPALSQLGVVFQQPTLDPELTVIANLRYHARLHGIPAAEARRRIGEALARIDLTSRANSRVRELSGGNRRRIELVRALLHQPQLLLMDEPTVGLDPASRRAILDYVLELCEARHIAVLWATHLVDEAERAHRVVVLHKGEILKQGAPQALVADTGCDSLADAFLELTGTEAD